VVSLFSLLHSGIVLGQNEKYVDGNPYMETQIHRDKDEQMESNAYKMPPPVWPEA